MKTRGTCHDIRFVAGGRALLTVTETDVRLWDACTGEPLTAPLQDDFSPGFDEQNKADALVVGDTLLVRRNRPHQPVRPLVAGAGRPPCRRAAQAGRGVAGRRRDAAGNLHRSRRTNCSPSKAAGVAVSRGISARRSPRQTRC